MLKYLSFADLNITNSSSSLEDEKYENIDDLDSPIKCLWPSVKLIYAQCSKLIKINSVKIPAIYVMITIVRMAPKNFYIDECENFCNKIKLSSILDCKNTYLDGLKIVYEIIRGYKK